MASINKKKKARNSYCHGFFKRERHENETSIIF